MAPDAFARWAAAAAQAEEIAVAELEVNGDGGSAWDALDGTEGVEHHQVEPQEVEPRMALAHRTALVHPLVVRLALVLPTEEAPYLLEEVPCLLLPMAEVGRKPFCLRRRRLHHNLSSGLSNWHSPHLAAREAALGDSLSKLHHHLVQVHCLLEERRHHHHPILP